MKILKRIAGVFLLLLLSALIAAAVSALAEHGGGEAVATVRGIRLTVTGTGAGLTFLTAALFASLYRARGNMRGKRGGKTAGGWGERLNAAGFGFLPAAAVWKAFEHITALGRGTEVTEHLPLLPFLTAEGRFCPSRIEMAGAVLFFAGILIWLIVRRNDLPGNGDLLLTSLCLWSLFRPLTERFRAEPLFSGMGFSPVQILFFILADVCLAVWTVRKARKQSSSIIFTVLEWIAVLACETVMVLNSSGILNTDSGIGDLAVHAGCAALCGVLMLFSAKDSRS